MKNEMKKYMVEAMMENEMESINGGACQAPVPEYGSGDSWPGPGGAVYKVIAQSSPKITPYGGGVNVINIGGCRIILRR